MGYFEQNSSFFRFLFVALPFLTVPAFFLHPKSFVWVCAGWVADGIKHVLGGTGIAYEIMREGSLPTFIVLFWIISLGVGFFVVGRINKRAQLRAKQQLLEAKKLRKIERKKGRARSQSAASAPPSVSTSNQKRGSQSGSRQNIKKAQKLRSSESDRVYEGMPRANSDPAPLAERDSDAESSDDDDFFFRQNEKALAQLKEDKRKADIVRQKLRDEELRRRTEKKARRNERRANEISSKKKDLYNQKARKERQSAVKLRRQSDASKVQSRQHSKFQLQQRGQLQQQRTPQQSSLQLREQPQKPQQSHEQQVYQRRRKNAQDQHQRSQAKNEGRGKTSVVQEGTHSSNPNPQVSWRRQPNLSLQQHKGNKTDHKYSRKSSGKPQIVMTQGHESAKSRELKAFLSNLGIEQYAAGFISAHVDLDTLAALSDTDLDHFLPFGPKRILQRALQVRVQQALKTMEQLKQHQQQKQQQSQRRNQQQGQARKWRQQEQEEQIFEERQHLFHNQSQPQMMAQQHQHTANYDFNMFPVMDSSIVQPVQDSNSDFNLSSGNIYSPDNKLNAVEPPVHLSTHGRKNTATVVEEMSSLADSMAASLFDE